MDFKPAAAYIRVSTEEQAEYSPLSQLKKIREYAKKNGYFVPDKLVFADEGISGKTTKKRNEFNRMITLAKTKPTPFDTIFVWKFSRFARNREDSVVYKSMLRKELGIRVVSVSEDIGDDKMSVLFESMIEAMDEYYSINLAEEVKRGMTERVKQGGACAAAPFGYTMEEKRLVVCEEEAEVIRQVFEMFADGESMVKIARKLNRMGIYSHRGNKIENRTVEYWLNNPVYIGKVRWNPTGKTQRYHWNDSGIIVADGFHQAIISEELWDRVRKRLYSKEHKIRKTYECKSLSSWLVGIFKCGICGGAMVNCGGYFYCGNKIKGTCVGNGGIKVARLETEVLGLIKAVGCVPEVNFIPVTSKKPYDRRIDEEKERLRRVKLSYENGVDSLEEYTENKKRIQSNINRLIKERDSCKRMEEPAEMCIADILESENISAAEKSEAVRTVIDRIIKVDKEEYNIFLNFRCTEDQTEN